MAHDWRECAHEKGYKQPVAHLSCLDTNYLIPQMSGEESRDISTSSRPVHHYKSVELLTPELYSVHTVKATGAGSRY